MSIMPSGLGDVANFVGDVKDVFSGDIIVLSIVIVVIVVIVLVIWLDKIGNRKKISNNVSKEIKKALYIFLC